jgi:cell division protein FtsN
MQLGAIADAAPSTFSGMEGSLPPTADADESAAETPPVEEEDVQQDLEWYHSVNKKGSEPAGVQPSEPSGTTKETAETSSSGSSVGSAAVTYSVQVGAFKRRPEAEAHALNVRSKGFDSRVESPKSSGQLYLVKVGKFDTRAEAVAVQLRLRKNGFSCFVKTN